MFYDEMRAVASDVFAEFKQGTIEYVQMVPATGATLDNPGVPTEQVTEINAVAKPVSTRYIDGTHIVGTEKEVVMPNDGTEPQMSGFVRVDGVQHKIKRIMRRPEAGVAVAYTLIVGR